MVRIRLQRQGRKRKPFYFIVIMDQRAKRDGRFLEKLGTYDPMVHPKQVHVNVDRTLHWLGQGASPSDTVKSLLSHSGVLLKKHLLEGVKKNAFDEAEALRRFDVWVSEKEKTTHAKKEAVAVAAKKASSLRMDGERKVREAKQESRKKKEEEALAKVVAKEAPENE